MTNRLGTDGGAGGDFGSVVVRVVSRRWLDRYMGGRSSCGSVEFRGVDMSKNLKCRVDEVKMRANSN